MFWISFFNLVVSPFVKADPQSAFPVAAKSARPGSPSSEPSPKRRKRGAVPALASSPSPSPSPNAEVVDCPESSSSSSCCSTTTAQPHQSPSSSPCSSRRKMPEVFDILWGTPITSHAWNRDRSQVALVPNNNEVHIYGQRGSEWVVLHVLKEHDKLITSVDWAPNSNRIVTCSQDRNAYVWSWDTATSSWKPTLVLLRINRAATFVQWSPAENKFAVGSGARMICVCYFEEENDWWVAKHIKSPIRSTVLSLQWHPDNIHLAVGCADMTARVFSTIVKGIDSVSAPSVWGGKSKFGTLVSEYKSPASGWVHSVAFSPSGNVLAFAGHDSSLNISYGPQEGIVSINTNHLPLVSILFISENYIVGCGHDCVPYLYSNRGGNWELVDKLDQGKKRPSATSSGILSSRFLAMDTRGQASTEVELNSNHQNTIKTTRVYEATGNAVTKFSTTSLDGKLIIWDILASGLAKVQL